MQDNPLKNGIADDCVPEMDPAVAERSFARLSPHLTAEAVHPCRPITTQRIEEMIPALHRQTRDPAGGLPGGSRVA